MRSMEIKVGYYRLGNEEKKIVSRGVKSIEIKVRSAKLAQNLRGGGKWVDQLAGMKVQNVGSPGLCVRELNKWSRCVDTCTCMTLCSTRSTLAQACCVVCGLMA